MELRLEEISKIIRSQIKHYESTVEHDETGSVVLVGDGIARCLLYTSPSPRDRG